MRARKVTAGHRINGIRGFSMIVGRRTKGFICAGLALLLVSQLASAMEPGDGSVPNCPAYQLKSQNGGDPGVLPVNNSQVLQWKSAAQNQFTDRGHVQGNVVRVYPDRNGHSHFAIQIGSGAADTVEIIYNQDFGDVPTPSVGTSVEACGDYITSVGPSPGPNGEVIPLRPMAAWFTGFTWLRAAADIIQVTSRSAAC